MKNGALNYEDKKSKMKERLKLKLEYSEKIKNLENNKMLKKLNILKNNNELPKIKVLNSYNNYIEEIDTYNNSDNYLTNNKIKKGNNINMNKKNEAEYTQNSLSKSSSKKPKNMNLISFNENINNIYKKITINDFNNKEINQKVFYNVVHNTHNNLESNSDDVKIEDMDYQSKNKVSYKYSDKVVGSYKNDQLLLNILNQNKEDYNIPEKQKTQIKKNKKDDERFDFLRTKKSLNTNMTPLAIKNKYNTNKSSVNKLLNSENDINFDFLENDENTKKKYNNFINKKTVYEEDNYYLKKDNLNLKQAYNNEISNNDYISNTTNKNLDEAKNKSSENESSDVTIFSFLSEDIKDISSDYFDF